MPFSLSQRDSASRLEARMQKVSLVFSLAAFGLMIYGFTRSLIIADTFSFPGNPFPPLQQLILHPSLSLGETWMSAGVLLLGILPSVRVLLAFWLYFRSKNLWSTFIALVVFLELLLSVRLSV
jgi:Protein of unknown function (DUF1634)